jgi:anti-sigma regulatory factor (Ser/Thr protein kinase)
MEDLSLHILDIAENSIAAGAKNISIMVDEDIGADLLTIEISDDGRGMNAAAVKHATDPFYTTRTTRRVGLGLPLLLEAANAAGGSMEVKSSAGGGTWIKAVFRYSHVDRKPLGNMAETVTVLLSTSEEIDIRYEHARNDKTLLLDTRDIRERIGGGPLNSVKALAIMRTYLTHEESTLAQ